MLVQLARETAGRGQRVVAPARPARSRGGSPRRRKGGRSTWGRPAVSSTSLVPGRVLPGGACGPLGRRAPVGERGAELLEAAPRVGDERHGPVLRGVVARGVQRDRAGAARRRRRVQEPVVKSCSRVPTARTTSASAASAFADELPDDADRAGEHGVVPRERRLARRPSRRPARRAARRTRRARSVARE